MNDLANNMERLQLQLPTVEPRNQLDALFTYIDNNDRVSILQMFIEGFDFSRTDYQVVLPLHYIFICSDLSMFQFIESLGANILKTHNVANFFSHHFILASSSVLCDTPEKLRAMMDKRFEIFQYIIQKTNIVPDLNIIITMHDMI